MILSLIACIILTFIICFAYEIGPQIDHQNRSDYFNKFLIAPWWRFAPYLLGILWGFTYSSRKNKEGNNIYEKINKIFDSNVARHILYLLGTFLIIFFIFIENAYKTNYNNVINSFSISLFRILFTIGVILIIYPGTIGYSLLLQNLLGFNFFKPIAKLTIYTIMLSIIIYYAFFWAAQNGQFAQIPLLTRFALSVLFAGYLFAFWFCVLYDRPIHLWLKNIFFI